MGEVVNRTARLFRRLADQRLAALGLSAGYLPVVTALIDGETMSQKALTEHAGIEQPTMAATLARMARDGIVERQLDAKDRRSVRFTLTASTLKRATLIKGAIHDMNSAALAGLSSRDIKKLRSMLARIAAVIEMALDSHEA